MAFRFSAFKFPVDEDFKPYEFVKIEELVNKTITIGDVVKFSDKSVETQSGSKTKTTVRFTFTIDGVTKYTYSSSYGIAGVLKNIVDSEGAVPKVPVKIVSIPTPNGKNTYGFDDVE